MPGGEAVARSLIPHRINRGPFGARVRIVLADIGSLSRQEMRRFGTYGIIRGARYYLIGVMEEGGKPEEFGYSFERVILHATELELGSCWLGGTFKRSPFEEAAGMQGGEQLWAVSPIGYPADGRSFADRMVRLIAGSARRLPGDELFFPVDSSKTTSVQKLRDALELVRIAPSASNKQPWRIYIDTAEDGTGRVHFFLNRDKGYREKLEKLEAPDLQRSDIGIAMLHFEIGMGSVNWIIEDPGISTPGEYVASAIV